MQLTGAGIGLNWIPGDAATSFTVGADWAWRSNPYDWHAFLAALGCSTFGCFAWAFGAWLVKKATGKGGPGISGVLMRIPGMKTITATPNWTADDVQLEVGHGMLPVTGDQNVAEVKY
jgi:hypothetical protein